MKPFRLMGTVVDASMEDEGHLGDEFMTAIEQAIEAMKADPGGANEELNIVLVNDFEDEESEDDESEDETTATEKEG